MIKNKSLAVLLAFFLGGLGVHKFYLGYTLAGILYLIFSWTFIPSILAFFDFLGLLLMSDQAFNSKHNAGYLPQQYPVVNDRPNHAPPKATPTPEKPRLDVRLLKICNQPAGATVGDCVIATGEEPSKVKKTLEDLYRQNLLTIDNREDGAIVYRTM